jgi:hypothetical protein
MVADVSSPTAAVAAVTSCTAAVDDVSSLTAAVVAFEGMAVIASDIAVGRSPRDNRSPSSSSPSTKSESPSASIKQKLHQSSARAIPRTSDELVNKNFIIRNTQP